MKKIPPFTVILLMVVLAVTGIAGIPLLNVQYSPVPADKSITVSYSWGEASERVMETEVTSRLEGVLTGIRNCSSVSSVSDRGSGSVTLKFRKGTDMAAARFEVASRIRNAYASLPDGVSYPSISLGTRGTGSRTALTYVFKSPLPSLEIERYVTGHVTVPLSAVDGVDKVSFWGATPFELEIIFDSDAAAVCGITADMVSSAFNSWFSVEMLGMAASDAGTMSVKLACRTSDDIGDIPIGSFDGRIVHLRDIAVWKYKEAVPSSYFRMNGLNTVMLSVETAPETNFLTTVASVKRKMAELQQSFPEEITASVSYDSTEYISSELDKIYFRTLLCLLILLVFVYLVNRSLKYLLVISTTLAVNIFVAVLFYNIFALPVHIYTLAGITVSLGIIIDSSIMMTDHYSYYRNRSVFSGLLGATATTIGALCIILLLPEKDKANLEDFSKVIMINLAVSLLTAWFFVPSLLDRFPVRRKEWLRPVRRRRRVIRWNRIYEAYIRRGLRFRWAYLLVLAAVFGVTFWMFWKVLDRSDYYREPGRDILYVQAGMPEGCSVAQLNEVVRSMENYLSLFDGIETFITRIYSYDDATIEISFKPEYEDTYFPAELKSKVTSMASNFGGAVWRVWGVNDSYFNNDVVSEYKSNRITLKGYGYDDLQGYADSLMNILRKNRRVSGPELMTGIWSVARNEYNLDYDFSMMTAIGVDPYSYYSRLRSILYTTDLRDIPGPDGMVHAVMKSSMSDSFDLWHVLNTQVTVDSVGVRLSEMGSIEKRRTGFPIRRYNQSYEITVGFDFIGSYELSKKFIDNTVKYFNEELLPVGYKASSPSYGGWGEKERWKYAWLLLLVAAVIYVMCSMTFESLKYPLAVILLIPISFIGVFLVFGFSDFTFDQGGFAALVMLSGIVVNAGIYFVNAMRNDCSGRDDVRKFVKAFNHKIKPVMLTVISTVLGLVPFLFDGPDEVFWFDFAIGTMGGMAFSVIALLVYFPIFCVRFRRSNGRKRRVLY